MSEADSLNAKPDRKRVTMMDVAEASGVSYQTVSRVINNHPSVAPGTRERVLEAIQKLNYRPNKAARSLATRQSHTLAVITYNMRFFGPTQMIVNIEQSAREAGYDLIFSNFDPLRDSDVGAIADSVLQWSVDGILIIAQVASAAYDELVTQFRDIPLIQIDNEPGATTPSIIVNQYTGSRAITQHLIDLGHRDICEITGPRYAFGALARHNAWQDALADADLSPLPSYEGDWSAASGYTIMQRLLAECHFTALVAGNDQMALGAISALREHGLRVPEDVSVVGFDDIPEAAYFAPPLTTVRQDFNELGRQGLAYLVELIQVPGTLHEQRVIAPQLVMRGSTCPPQ
jgi:DNA-binding LacI/PurR family transcriptional regulator